MDQFSASTDWTPALYQQFGGLRLRPAMDLLAQVGDVPLGTMVDLGCGAGAVGPALRLRYPDRSLSGVDSSPAMLEQAEATGAYQRLVQDDVGTWSTSRPVSLLFANAVLNWLPDHRALLPRLAEFLMPGGVLAVQSPKQQEAPSHALLRSVSTQMFPDRFDWMGWHEDVLDLPQYHQILTPLGEVSLWESTYAQILPAASDGHPVRQFTQSTAARRVTDRLNDADTADFFESYDAALEEVYPRAPNGTVLFPFRRIFFTLRVPRD